MKRHALIGILVGILAAGVQAGPDPRGIMELEGYGNSDAVGVTAKRGRNDFTIKEPLASGDKLFFIGGYGYNGTAFGTSAAAAIEFNATQAWTSNNNGTSVTIKTTPNGSVTPATVATFGQDGSLTTGRVYFGLQLSTAPKTSTTLIFNSTGTLAYNTTDNQLCISTSSNQNSFVVVASFTVTCTH